jgi:hypothetical protein
MIVWSDELPWIEIPLLEFSFLPVSQKSAIHVGGSGFQPLLTASMLENREAF